MNLKTVCKIAFVVTLLSLLLTLSGSLIFYTTIFSEHFNITMLIHMVVGILTFLLDAGGFIVLLLAIISKLNNPESKTRTLFILAGILILLGTLINTMSNMTSGVELFRHLPILRFILYISMYFLIFISGLCMGLLAFVSSGNSSAGKSLAALVLAAKVVLAVLVIISYVIYFSASFHNNIGIGIGSIVMSLGYFINMAAVIFFLLVFLKHRPWPPTADAVAPSPEPIPILSAEADLPEQQ